MVQTSWGEERGKIPGLCIGFLSLLADQRNLQFVTGAALFPTAGSWNPTLTMCGYAQDLARKLHPKIGALVDETSSQEELSL